MPDEKAQQSTKPTNIDYFATNEDKPRTPVERLAVTLVLEMGLGLIARLSLSEVQSSVEERINEFLTQRDSQS